MVPASVRVTEEQIPKYPEGFRAPRPGSAAIHRTLSSFPKSPALKDIDGPLLSQWLASLRVEALSAVEWRWQEGWGVGPRRLEDSMWFWFEKADGWGWVGNPKQRFTLRSGDAVLIPQGTEHMFRQTSGTSSHLIAVHFRASVLESVDLLDLLGYPVHLQAARYGELVGPRSWRLAQEFGAKPAGWTTAMSSSIQDLLLTLLHDYAQDFAPRSEKKAHADLPRLLPALQWIEQSLGDSELSVNTLARTVHLGEAQFRKLFRRVTGMTPVQFLRVQRTKKACSVLIATDCTVEEIAQSCGFSCPRFFRRVFKELTGYAPISYRRNGRENSRPAPVGIIARQQACTAAGLLRNSVGRTVLQRHVRNSGHIKQVQSKVWCGNIRLLILWVSAGSRRRGDTLGCRGATQRSASSSIRLGVISLPFAWSTGYSFQRPSNKAIGICDPPMLGTPMLLIS